MSIIGIQYCKRNTRRCLQVLKIGEIKISDQLLQQKSIFYSFAHNDNIMVNNLKLFETSED